MFIYKGLFFRMLIVIVEVKNKNIYFSPISKNCIWYKTCQLYLIQFFQTVFDKKMQTVFDTKFENRI